MVSSESTDKKQPYTGWHNSYESGEPDLRYFTIVTDYCWSVFELLSHQLSVLAEVTSSPFELCQNTIPVGHPAYRLLHLPNS